MVKIIQKLLPVAVNGRRSGQKNTGIVFIVCHDTGNANSTALQNANYYKNTYTGAQTSAHYFVDHTGAYQLLPDTEKAWHVLYSVPTDNLVFNRDANDASLGIELCYGPAWTDEQNELAYQNYVELIAILCKKHGLDPETRLVAHATLDPSRRTDPMNAFYVMKKTWLGFIEDVMKAYDIVTPDQVTPVTFPKSITYGEKGQHVVELQAFLRKLGFFKYESDTGNYFQVTKESVQNFQKAYGLPITGQFDEVTRTKANAIASKL